MTDILKMTDLPLSGQRVLIREDLNVPIREGKITSDARLQAALPSIEFALKAGAKVLIMSHLGRPVEGEYDDALSLLPVAQYLSDALGQKVSLVSNLDEPVALQNGQCALLENVRFNRGEKKNDEALAKQYAALCDVFVMDAFGTAHRAQASTHGVALHAPVACAGPLLSAELEALAQALEAPKKPLVAVVGGSKVSTKLSVLERLAEVADEIIVGGGIANTFIAAAGHSVGQSLYESDLIPTAKALLEKVQIPIPVDVVCAKRFAEDAEAVLKPIQEVADDDMILDIGPESAKAIAERLHKAGTIIWNGPVGVFEFEAFSQGTKVLSEAIATSTAFSIAGGGDTLAAIDQFGIRDQVSYISTGGGVFLEFVEGKALPAVEALKQRAAKA